MNNKINKTKNNLIKSVIVILLGVLGTILFNSSIYYLLPFIIFAVVMFLYSEGYMLNCKTCVNKTCVRNNRHDECRICGKEENSPYGLCNLCLEKIKKETEGIIDGNLFNKNKPKKRMFWFSNTCKSCGYYKIVVEDNRKVDENKFVTGSYIKYHYCRKLEKNLTDFEPCELYYVHHPIF